FAQGSPGMTAPRSGQRLKTQLNGFLPRPRTPLGTRAAFRSIQASEDVCGQPSGHQPGPLMVQRREASKDRRQREEDECSQEQDAALAPGGSYFPQVLLLSAVKRPGFVPASGKNEGRPL